MSRQNVGCVIDRLLTEDELRTRFALDPLTTLAELHLRGLALTPNEIDMFVQADVRAWFSEDDYGGELWH
jgi:hypothetical protein